MRRRIFDCLFPELGRATPPNPLGAWPVNAQYVSRDRKYLARSLRKLAGELKRGPAQILERIERMFGHDSAWVAATVAGIVRMAGRLAPARGASSGDMMSAAIIDGLRRGRGAPADLERRLMIQGLAGLFREATGRPQYALVADLLNWRNENRTQYTADDIKKALRPA